MGKVREKPTERKEVALSFVEKSRKDDGIFTTSNDLIRHLNDEFTGEKLKHWLIHTLELNDNRILKCLLVYYLYIK